MKRIADLSVFVSVVKAGSLSEASNDLGLSVASISKYISRIEQELGKVMVLKRRALLGPDDHDSKKVAFLKRIVS